MGQVWAKVENSSLTISLWVFISELVGSPPAPQKLQLHPQSICDTFPWKRNAVPSAPLPSASSQPYFSLLCVRPCWALHMLSIIEYHCHAWPSMTDWLPSQSTTCKVQPYCKLRQRLTPHSIPLWSYTKFWISIHQSTGTLGVCASWLLIPMNIHSPICFCANSGLHLIWIWYLECCCWVIA